MNEMNETTIEHMIDWINQIGTLPRPGERYGHSERLVTLDPIAGDSGRDYRFTVPAIIMLRDARVIKDTFVKQLRRAGAVVLATNLERCPRNPDWPPDYIENPSYDVVIDFTAPHLATVTLRDNTFTVGGLDMWVSGTAGRTYDVHVLMDGGFGLADVTRWDIAGNEQILPDQYWVEIDGPYCVKTFTPAAPVADSDTTIWVTITAAELAAAQRYRADYPLNPPE